MTLNEITGAIVDTAMDVHTRLGPGLLESVYQHVLAYVLRKRGLRVDTEVLVPVDWDRIHFDIGFRADLMVEDAVILELKSVEQLAPVYAKQLLTYIRLADKRVGLLINFGEAALKNGIRRVVNKFEE